PYASGGIGAISMHTSLALDLGLGDNNPVSHVSETRFGWDAGGGVMAFVNHIGFRTDVRYYRATTVNDLANRPETTPGQNLTLGLLSGIRFWRANIGVAFRW